MSDFSEKLEAPQKSLMGRARASLKHLKQRFEMRLIGDGAVVIVCSMGPPERWERTSKDTYELAAGELGVAAPEDCRPSKQSTP
jgi:hypothetical protein